MHPTRSGFLSDYSQLAPIDAHGRRLAKPADTAALRDIDSFCIERVVWLADDLGQPASSPKRAEKIRSSLETALEKELILIRPVVDAPGPHTASVRAAITGVQEGKTFANLLLLVAAGPLFNGGAVAEIEVVGPAGNQIAAESVAYHGREWELLGFFSRSRHAEKAAGKAARDLSWSLQGRTPRRFWERSPAGSQGVEAPSSMPLQQEVKLHGGEEVSTEGESPGSDPGDAAQARDPFGGVSPVGSKPFTGS